ncbi:docking protein 2-like, partial [Clarias magur]
MPEPADINSPEVAKTPGGSSGSGKEDGMLNGHKEGEANPFAEYMWMENEEEYNRQVEEELLEQEFLERCFQEMLEEEDQDWFIPARDLPSGVGHIQQQFSGLSVNDSNAEDIVKWKRYWLNLYPNSRNGVARLELTETGPEKSPVIVRKQPDRKIVRLAECISVVRLPPHAEALPGDNMAAFCVDTDEKKLVFAVEKEGCGEWVERICEIAFQKNSKNVPQLIIQMEDNQIYASREEVFEFLVTVQQSEASVRCSLQGLYWLQVGEETFMLKDTESKHGVMEWPYKLLRRYGRDKVTFSIEAGRRCDSGPGTFVFETKQGDEIVRLMELAIQQQKGLSVSAAKETFNYVDESEPVYSEICNFTSCPAQKQGSMVQNEEEPIYSLPEGRLVKRLPFLHSGRNDCCASFPVSFIMSNRLAFQTQLASIMEVLANAAVAEICKLVDDDYAVINLQMSQCQRENKALKRKLHLMELRMARGYAERRIRESSGNRSSRVQVSASLSDKYRAPVADIFPNQDELYGRQLNDDVWRDGEPSSADVPIGHPVIKHDEKGHEDSSQAGPNAVLVKAETSDEGHTQQQLFIREDGVAEPVCEGVDADYGAAQVDKVDGQNSRTRHEALEHKKTDDEEPDVLFIKEEHSELEEQDTQTRGGMTLQDGFVESSTDVCGNGVSSSPAQITLALSMQEPHELESSLVSGESRLQEQQQGTSSQSTDLQITIQ